MQQNIEGILLEIKQNINALINKGCLEEAKILLKEYEKINPNDIECFSINAVILLMEGNIEEAKKILKEGIFINLNDMDLLYNLGYLYETTNNNIQALAAYNIAKTVGNNVDLIEMINERITSLGEVVKEYKVILYGDYNTCQQFKGQILDWDFVGVCSENRNSDTINIGDLDNYNYDFIFVVGKFGKEEVYGQFPKNLHNKIYFHEDFKISVIEGLDYKILKLLGRKDINGIVMGLSYAEVGIKESLLQNNFINFALSAQDLYYDFLLLKFLYEFEEVKNTLKYVIINLGYYSFDYDISMSIGKNRIHRYCKYFKEYHHNKDIIGVDIYRSFYEKNITFDHYINMNKVKENTLLRVDDANGEYEALRNATMDYKNTRQEYIDIFDKYLMFLLEKNIKPIIVVCPTSCHYRKHFNKTNKKDLFYNIINKFKKKYDFQVIDYFESDKFDDTDFWDYSHLNGKGAEKFTKILNSEIRW